MLKNSLAGLVQGSSALTDPDTIIRLSLLLGTFGQAYDFCYVIATAPWEVNLSEQAMVRESISFQHRCRCQAALLCVALMECRQI